MNLPPQLGITFNINSNTPTDPAGDKLNLTLTGISGTTGTSSRG